MFHSLLKSVLVVSLTMTTFIASYAQAAVTLNFPDSVDLLAVNGEKPDASGGLFSSEKTITLPDGINQIVFRYVPTFDRGREVHHFTSDTIIARFDASNTNLVMELPEYRNETAAQTFNQTLNWSLLNSNGGVLNVTQDKLGDSGLQIGRNYESEILAYNQKGGVAAVAVTSQTTPVVASNQAAAAIPVANADGTTYQTTSEQMLHYWYNQADPATKERFLNAISKK